MWGQGELAMIIEPQNIQATTTAPQLHHRQLLSTRDKRFPYYFLWKM